MFNNIRSNTINEIAAQKGLNTLNEIKNEEIIKYKRHTPKQKELLTLFNDLLNTILSEKTLKSESQKDKILMSSEDENENENENHYENNDETMSQDEKKKNKTIKWYFR